MKSTGNYINRQDSKKLILRLFKFDSVFPRLEIIRKVICFFFIAGILLSLNLWRSDRFFPLAPFVKGLPDLGEIFSNGLTVSLVGLLIAGIFFKHKSIFYMNMCLLIFLVAYDQMRCQPWVYVY